MRLEDTKMMRRTLITVITIIAVLTIAAILILVFMAQ